ncbi:MAG: hypothetical protein ACRDWY_01935, partial [Actinomycetes bacterium]
PRFLRVLDASEVDGVVYVVTEWVRATNLVDLLEDGPLPPHEALALGADVAGALAASHEQGLSHRCLQPEHVLRTSHGQTKVAGLGVDAAARGLVPDADVDAARHDTHGAASVLYAALTARWPGEGDTGLAAAPHDGGALCSPRQVRAGVPDELDDVVCRALGVPDRHHAGEALNTPAELLAALSAAHVPDRATSRIPVIGPATSRPNESASAASPHVAPYDDDAQSRSRSKAGTVAWTAAALVLVAGLALFGGQLAITGLGGGEEPSATGGAGPTAEEAGAARVRPLELSAVTTFDPPPGNGDENPERAELAIDDDTGSAWPTLTYEDPFGPTGLKDGVGLILDLGRPRDVSRVAVAVQGGATDLEVRVAGDEGSTLDDYQPFDEPANNADGRTVLRSDEPVRARFVLLWLTSLPLHEDGYRGEIAEVTVSG